MVGQNYVKCIYVNMRGGGEWGLGFPYTFNIPLWIVSI